jgi:hypothetical protein
MVSTKHHMENMESQQYCKTKDQVADISTKPLSEVKFQDTLGLKQVVIKGKYYNANFPKCNNPREMLECNVYLILFI